MVQELVGKMNCIVCAIAKQENAYLYEWAKYHIDLGFSVIHLFDNNEVDGEQVSDVFCGTELESRVVVHDVRGKRFVQKVVYQECYDKEDFDWCVFIDVDEFVTFTEGSGIKTIEAFLCDKNDWEAVHLNWMCFGDGGTVRYEKGLVRERFKRAWEKNVCFSYLDKKENSHIKSIIKKGLEIDWCKDSAVFSSNPHTPFGLVRVCNPAGRTLENSPFSDMDYSIAYIRHYITKSVEEYGVKVERCCADILNKSFYSFPKFFRINVPTAKKLYWVHRHYPEVGLVGCVIEHLKYYSINHKLPTKFLFRSVRKKE